MLLLVAASYGLCNTIPTFLFNLGFSPMLLSVIRMALGLLTLAIIFRGPLFKINKTDWKYGLFLGFFNFIQFVGLMYAIKLAGPASAALIYSLGIIFVPFINWIINRQKPTLINVVAVLICAGGLLLALMRFDMQFVFGWGEGIALLSSIGYATFFVLVNKYSRYSEPAKLNFIQIIVMCLGSLILFFAIDFSTAVFNAEMLKYIWVFIVLGVVGDGLIFLLQTKVQSKVDANSGSLYLYTFALFGVAFSIIFGFEAFSWQLIVGALIMFVGIILAPATQKIKEQLAKNKQEATDPALLNNNPDIDSNRTESTTHNQSVLKEALDISSENIKTDIKPD